jgi:phosphonate transport system substrate-binding protein
MRALRLTTCMAGNTVEVTAAVAAALRDALRVPIQVVTDLPWPARYAAVATGAIDMAWICGLPFAQFLQRPDVDLELLATPVYAAPRYSDAPVYFSDVIVRADSPFTRFDDLRGRTFVINEPNSMSGWHTVRRHLRHAGQSADFFGSVLESGAHVHSIRRVLSGDGDAAAIDSTVWDWQVAQEPSLAEKLRVVEVIGPTPAPPWVINRGLDGELRHRVRDGLLALHTHPAGRAILAQGDLRRFDASDEEVYGDLAR